LENDLQAAATLLTELEHDIQAALIDIRRLVYNLRPPALDDLGLAGALRLSAAQYRLQSVSTNGRGDAEQLQIAVEVFEGLPDLPAAVEVAAYRIVQEALTNVVRHAHARACRVRLSVDDALCVEISDDGAGLPATCQPGVGMASMRERAEELGGTCAIESVPNRGTSIRARLPLLPLALSRQ
jgi:signal transduction histidine kinase